MTKNLLFLLATAGLILNIGGCTSKTSQDESQVVENADVDKLEAEELTAPPQDPAAMTEDASLQAALGETTDTTVTTTDTSELTQSLDSTPTDVAAAPTLDESSLNDVPQPLIADSSTPTTEAPSSLEESTPAMDTSSTAALDTPADTSLVESTSTSTASIEDSSAISSSTQETAAISTSAKSSSGSELKKIALTPPYQASGGWVNTVYVARPGEKLKDISQTIFGSDKTKELKKISENSYLKSRPAKAGDKIYYISPNRPDDSSKTLFYYEDMGMVPETYVAKKGDNLKKVSKDILGYDRAWIEMWTSNPTESKTALNEGDTLRYWRSASSIQTAAAPKANDQAAKLIDASQAPVEVAATTAPPAPPQEMTLPPPPEQMAANDLPPPPDMNQAAAELPPPPPPEMAPPPPPPPMEAAEQAPRKNIHADEEMAPAAGLDNDTMMSLGAVGVLTAALAFILIRRKKKKAAEQAAMSETNVGT